MTHRGPRDDIVLALRPGVETVTIRYAVDVPHRYWPFGCVRRRCSLSGAIAPLPSEPSRGGPWQPPGGRVVAPVPWTVVEAKMAGPGDDELVVVGGRGELTPYPSVVWAPQWFRERVFVRGVEVEVLHPKPRPHGRVPHETFLQLRRDVPGHVLRIAGELAALLARTPAALPPDSRIVAIQGPLRSEVAQAHPGVVLVSDEALQIVPFDRFTKFHDASIARAFAEAFLELRLRGLHDASTALWLPGTMALALLEAWQKASVHLDEFASDLLRNFTFVPSVDAFLYTQQASFSHSYFRGVEDAPPLRNHPLWFSHTLPTGRRIHEKLVDTLGPDRLQSLYERLFGDPARDPIRESERAYGHTLGWFFDQWLGPYPPVDYLIDDVESVRGPDGYAHRITIRQIANRPVVEPVQVLVVERGRGKEQCDGRDTDGDGDVDEGCHYLVWNGQLRPGGDEPPRGTHVLALQTPNELRAVRLDPRHRTVQTAMEPNNVDARFNDRRPSKLRLFYTGAHLSVPLSELLSAATPAARFNAVSGLAALEASLRRDLRRTGQIALWHDREAIGAAGTGASLWWGRKRNNRRRRGVVHLSTTASWLSEGSLDPRGGARVTERAEVVHDTRRFNWWPERGRQLRFGVEGRQTVRSKSGGDDDRLDLALDADWVQLWPVVHNHVIATRAAVELVVPLQGQPEFRQLARVGGIDGLSGYVSDEAFGLGVAMLEAEYRHVFVNDLAINGLHAGYLRSLGGVLFGGAATASGCDSYGGWFAAPSWYGHVGYGLDARVSVLGVSPHLFRIEAAVPLVRRTGVRCLGQVLPDYIAERQGLSDPSRLLPPLNINVVFEQRF